MLKISCEYFGPAKSFWKLFGNNWRQTCGALCWNKTLACYSKGPFIYILYIFKRCLIFEIKIFERWTRVAHFVAHSLAGKRHPGRGIFFFSSYFVFCISLFCISLFSISLFSISYPSYFVFLIFYFLFLSREGVFFLFVFLI